MAEVQALPRGAGPAGAGVPLPPVLGSPGLPQLGTPTAPAVWLSDIVVEGSTVLRDNDILPVIEPFIGQWVGLSDLERIRQELTQLYVARGYVNSGVILKKGQAIDSGILTYRAIEGRLVEIRIEGAGRLNTSWIHRRLWPREDEPLNIEMLRERIVRLLEDPLIERLDATLVPTTEPGNAVLEVKLVRARPYMVGLRIDNFRPPSTGAIRTYVDGVLRNTTGLGDALGLSAGVGIEGEGKELAVAWTVPLNPAGTRLEMSYQRYDNLLLEEPVLALDIQSETWGGEIGIFHPFRNDPEEGPLSRTLTLGMQAGLWSNETSLLDLPFSFSPGAVHGRSRVGVVRLVQELLQRDTRHAFAVRSVLSVGVDAFSATIHSGNIPDSQFLAWLIQGQYARRLTDRGAQLILRGGAQIAGDRLLPLEQFAVGGADTVRGYRENELVGDNGFAATLELRESLWLGNLLDQSAELQGELFADAGSAWLKGRRSEAEILYGIGVGLLGSWEDHAHAELYWAHALSAVPQHDDYDLQDDGIYFLVGLNY